MKRNLIKILPILLLGGLLGLPTLANLKNATPVIAEGSTDSVVFSDFANKGSSSGGSGANISFTNNDVTVSTNGGYSTGEILRIYSGKKINIVSKNYKIGQIDFEMDSSYTDASLKDGVKDINDFNWSHTVSSQIRFKKITISFALSESTVSSISADLSTVPETITAGTAISYEGVKVNATLDSGDTYNVAAKCSFSPAEGTILNTVGPQTINVTYAASNTPTTTTGTDLTTSFVVSVTQGEKDNVFTKTSSISNGDKIIFVNTGDKKAASLTIDDGCLKANSVTIEDETAKFKDTDGIAIFDVVENSGSSFSFKGSNNKYLAVIGSKDDSKVLTFSSNIDDKSSWTLDGGSLKNKYNSSSYSKIYLQFNGSTHDFRMYSKTQTDVEFYKYTSGAEKISVQSTASVYEDKTITLNSTVSGFVPSSYLWTIADDTVAEIVGENTGKDVVVRGKISGSTNVTVKANNNDDLTATCVLTVKDKGTIILEEGNYFISDLTNKYIMGSDLSTVVDVDISDATNVYTFEFAGCGDNTYWISNNSGKYLTFRQNVIPDGKNVSEMILWNEKVDFWTISKNGDTYKVSTTYGTKTKSIAQDGDHDWLAFDGDNYVNLSKQSSFNHIEIGHAPQYKKYYVGDSFKTTGLIVYAVYDNDFKADITSKVTWDALKAGTVATGKASIGGAQVIVEVPGLNIFGPVAGTMLVNALKDTYLVGEMPTKSIEKVTVTYSDGISSEEKVLSKTEYKVTPDKIATDTTKVIVEMLIDSTVKIEKDITVEHAKYFATNMIEIGDKVTLGTTVGAVDGNITGGYEISYVDGMKSSHFGYLPTPEMEFTVVQGINANSFAFKYDDKYLTSNGKTLDFAKDSTITGYSEDGKLCFDYPYEMDGYEEPLFIKFTEDSTESFIGYVYSYERSIQIQGYAVMIDDTIAFELDVYKPISTLTPEHLEFDLKYKFNGQLVIYLPHIEEVNSKNSFTCTYVQSQNDDTYDYWEICPVNEPSKHVYFNTSSEKFGVSENADYDVMLYRDMTKDFSKQIKSLTVTLPESMPDTVKINGTFNWVGIKVKAVYENTTKTLPLGAYEVNIPALDSFGEKVCTVTYGTTNNKVTGTFKIYVVGETGQIHIKQNTYEIYVDDTLTFTTTESIPTSEPVTWKSSNPTLANFEDPHVGNLTAYKSGKVTITVTTFDGYYSDSKELTVSQRVEGLSLDIESKEIEAGQKFTITPTVSPSDAKNKNVIWSTNNNNVATVDNKGVVTGLSEGTAIITCTTQGKPTGADEPLSKTCTVTVKGGSAIRVTGVSLDCSYKEIEVKGTFQLNAVIMPENATDKTVSWSSNHENIATVSKTGLVKGVAKGECVITATTADGGFTAQCTIKVKTTTEPIHVESVSLNETSKTLNVNDSFTLVANVLPGDADNKSVSWSSSNESVATVDHSGKVVAVAPGNAVITVTTNDGGKTATCSVSVLGGPTPEPIHVDSVTLSKDTSTLVEGSSESLSVTVNPSNADNKNVTWSSSDTSIATVDQNGKVVAIKEGTVNITVTTEDGNKTATCVYTITKVEPGPEPKPKPEPYTEGKVVIAVIIGASTVGVGCAIFIPLGIHRRRVKIGKNIK